MNAALKPLLDELTKYLAKNGALQTAVDEFRTRFQVAGPGKPLPCPQCHLEGRIGRLIPLSEQDGYEPVKCADCGKVFAVKTQQ